MSVRKSPGSNPGGTTPSNSATKVKSPLREKIVQMYDVLLRGDNPTSSSFGESFWSEFFLLKPKINHFESELYKLNHEQVSAARVNLNTLFEQSLVNLSEEHHIRVVYALQTLCGLLKCAYKKQSTAGVDLVNLLMGFEVAEQRMMQVSFSYTQYQFKYRKWLLRNASEILENSNFFLKNLQFGNLLGWWKG